MGWASLKNGELLQTAEENGVDVLLTGDGTLSYEQNLAQPSQLRSNGTKEVLWFQ